MIYLGFIFLLIIHLVLLLNLQFTAWPEMFSYPYLLNNGFKMYQDIAFPYQPILPLILKNIYIQFGYSLSVLQIFTWSLILINDVLIFFVSIKIIGKKLLALVPTILYVILQPLTDGNMLWFDLATTPFILLGILLLISLKNYKNFFWFGFLLSLAFFIKQQTGILYLFLIIYLISQKKFKEILYILVGSTISATFIFLYILFNGNLKDYIFWTFEVPLLWYPSYLGYIHLPKVQEVAVILLLLSSIVLPSLSLLRKSNILFGVVFFLFVGAFLAALPRFEFFRFQPAIILYSVMQAYILAIIKTKARILTISVVTLSMILLLRENIHLFNLTPRFYGEREMDVSQRLREIVNPNEKVFLLNEHSLFYVLGEILPPKPWVDNYVWYMEIAGVQDKVIEGFKKDPPKLILRKPKQSGNWYSLGVYEPKKIVDYIEQNYQMRGDIDGELQLWMKN